MGQLHRRQPRASRRAEVLFNQHHWPVWGQTTSRLSLRMLRLPPHDQTVRLMNTGLTAPEIAEQLRLPASLDQHLHVHGKHMALPLTTCVRSISFTWAGLTPTRPTLDPLPPAAAAAKHVALTGGASCCWLPPNTPAEGDYRWAAELGICCMSTPIIRPPRDSAST